MKVLIITLVYGGLNKTIVAKLQQACNALVYGADATGIQSTLTAG